MIKNRKLFILLGVLLAGVNLAWARSAGELFNALLNDDPTQRSQAQAEFNGQDPADSSLVNLLEEKAKNGTGDDQVRAQDALAKSSHVLDTEGLETLLLSSDPLVRGCAIRKAQSQLSTDLINFLWERAKGGPPEIQARAIGALVGMGVPINQEIEFFKGALHSDNQELKSAAAFAFYRMGAAAAPAQADLISVYEQEFDTLADKQVVMAGSAFHMAELALEAINSPDTRASLEKIRQKRESSLAQKLSVETTKQNVEAADQQKSKTGGKLLSMTMWAALGVVVVFFLFRLLINLFR